MSLFQSGTLDITPAASAALEALGADLSAYLSRHQNGDWGEVDEITRRDNDYAAEHNQPICSSYKLSDGNELILLTLGDRSLTHVFLASEQQVRKVTTQQGYAIWAAFYDSEKNGLIAVEEPYVDAITSSLPITNALDVGTGTGRHALKLARRGITMTAIDESPQMLAVARQMARQEDLTIDFRQASLEEGLPFAPETFDFLICALMLCHIPNLLHAAQEFYRVLQPGGHLLITDFHPDAVERGWRTITSIDNTLYVLPDIRHTRSGYLEALNQAGFQLLKVIDAIVDEAPEGYLSEAFRSANKDKTYCLIVLAQKPAC
ncbi:MAG TPA: class I SAM-dependent methyltransferase [Ktedonobacteraceae bacterium]|jgi:ubiquinone/menaquinone biosynthesis C-methylase UbiE|nr:class I SAM-dependent methyltransferase [Ktedonobacteraceae bacterium]